jgi:hypothetical protein
MSGVHLLETTATISRNLVEEYFGSQPFSCECHAWSSLGGEIKSRPAHILIACKFFLGEIASDSHDLSLLF